MKTEIIKVDPDRPDFNAVKKCAQILRDCGLVVIPTETVYGIACAAEPKAIARLDRLKDRDPQKRYTLHIGDKQRVGQFVPVISGRAKKLIEKAWPGPVTIVFQVDDEQIPMVEKFTGPQTSSILYRGGTIGVRCVDNSAAREILEAAGVAVVAPSANPAGAEPAVDANGAKKYLDGKVEVIVDSGSCKYKKNSTVVKFTGNKLEILREGAVSVEAIKDMSTIKILFVCTGNTCRSPMAEHICKKYVAEKLHCTVDEITKIGYKVSSAGVSGADRMAASAQAVQVCRSMGIDLSGHRSRAVTEELIKESDYIFVMTSGHKQAIEDIFCAKKENCLLLSPGAEIPDPIGGGPEVYEACAGKLEKAIKSRIDEIIK